MIKRAREVLKIESQAVRDQLGHINRDFAKVVQTLYEITECGGQVIVMGIGKSGLVGRKIAATLSSTGSPAIFFHPSEGLHGDLGMVRPRDGILILSASGETEEIKKILPLLKEKSLVTIAITAKKKSRLARACDFVICSAVRKEACPFNITPTASTTAMLALGDALAMALMEKRGFKPSDFAKLHPGGTLGKKLSLTIQELMRKGKENPVVKVNSTVRKALLEMSRTRLGATSVVNHKGQLVGFFTDGDLRRKLAAFPKRSSGGASSLKSRQQSRIRGNLLDCPLKEVMTKNPCTLRIEQTLNEALNLLKSRGFDNLPVVNQKGKPVGILDERDLLSEGIS